jgi:hypothetical protein
MLLCVRYQEKQILMGLYVIRLNNKDCFHFGPLDQGWWPNGLYTVPTDEALVYDIISFSFSVVILYDSRERNVCIRNMIVYKYSISYYRVLSNLTK